MAVVEQLTLRAIIPSSQEIQELQNTVIKIENLAERTDTAERKIRQSSEQRKGGIFGKDTDTTGLPKSITRRNEDALTSRIADQKNANSIKSKDTTSAAPFVRANQFKQIQSEVSLLKEGQQKTTEALSFLTDFQGTAATRLLGAANKILPVGFALSVATTVYGLIVAQFGAGGIFDIRKQEIDAVKSLIGLERETDIIGGDTLFLGNPTLVQGVARNQTSNTENLRDGQRRFVLRSNGY